MVSGFKLTHPYSVTTYCTSDLGVLTAVPGGKFKTILLFRSPFFTKLEDGDLIFQLMFSFKLIEYFSSFVDDTEHYWFKELQTELSDNLLE